MNKHQSILLSSLLVLSVTGCASHNMALEDARTSYQNASNDPTVRQNAPVAMHDAEVALQQANQADKDGAKKEDVTHLADLAKNRVEIARVESQKKTAEDQYQEVSKDRVEAVNTARESEVNAAHQKVGQLEASNQQLQNNAVQNQADTTVLQAQSNALGEKNQSLEKELSALKMKPTTRGLELNLRDTVFEFGKSDLTVGARRDLEKISQELKNASGHRIVIEGHTDSVGSDSYNNDLSQRRADAVRDILMVDTDASLITARGMGKQYPIASNSTESGRAQNRRVTIVVLTADETK